MTAATSCSSGCIRPNCSQKPTSIVCPHTSRVGLAGSRAEAPRNRLRSLSADTRTALSGSQHDEDRVASRLWLSGPSAAQRALSSSATRNARSIDWRALRRGSQVVV
jgi:hypothetical protein